MICAVLCSQVNMAKAVERCQVSGCSPGDDAGAPDENEGDDVIDGNDDN